MSFITSRLVLDSFAIILTGISIKLLDDFVDYSIDHSLGMSSLVDILGLGSPIYALLFAVFACSINLQLSAPLILSAYSIGMLKDPSQMLFLGLTAWMESVIVIFVCWIFFGLSATLVSILLMITVEFVDDIIDYSYEMKGTTTNLVNVIGKTQLLLLSIATVIGAFIINSRTTILVSICAPGIGICLDIISRSYKKETGIYGN